MNVANMVAGNTLSDDGHPQPPLSKGIGAYFQREVLPNALDAWIDDEKSKIGHENAFNRHFYVFEPPRSLHTIDEELKAVSARIVAMLGELAE